MDSHSIGDGFSALSEEERKSSGYSFSIPKLAFPDCLRFPPSTLQQSKVPRISSSIIVEFPYPEVSVRDRDAGPFAVLVLMPEATVNENHFPPGREH